MGFIIGKRRSNKKHSILKKVRLMCYCITVITATLFGVVMIQVEKRGIKKQLESRANILASSLEQAVGTEFINTDIEDVYEYCLPMIEESEDLVYIVFTRADTGFSIVFQYDPTTTRRWWDVTLTDYWNPGSENVVNGIRTTPLTVGQVYHYTHVCDKSGVPWGYVHVGLALKDYNESVRTVYAGTGLVAGVTMLVGAFIAFFFARNLTKPLQSLQVYAHKVAAGAVTARAQISTNDEIEDLADSINSMVESLEKSQVKVNESRGQEASLREKEILLREIHHRVKNNMQILSSLIRLQVRQTDSEHLKDVLCESEARIRSMGLLHEKLYQSDSVSDIELNGYLNTLTNEILRMNNRTGAKIEIRLNVSEIRLGLDTALPCGLIVTELVTNSMKYAFPDGRPGIILVSVTRTAEGEYSLVVWDNGVGFPADFDFSKSKSLGMRLVNMLTAQLNGKVVTTGHRGTRTELKFKESLYKNRI
ncbi:MAG: two-component sensor histidine kinase [Verrucomicrobiales bacterium]|jgi:two-component sensor histidine kinase